jgi:hypothetical protein
VFSVRMLQVCLSRCCICFTHMLHAFLFRCCVWLQWFSSVFRCFLSASEACFKYFNCLQMYVAIVIFGCFKSKSGVASLLPTFCYIVSACPPPGAGRASIRRHDQVLLNRRCHVLSPLIAWTARALCGAHETECSARASVRTSGH